MHDDGGEHLEMIPKVIHYCWFGKNPKSDLINRCIESWRKYCPEYQIIEWNESNFDVTCNAYVKAAYEDKNGPLCQIMQDCMWYIIGEASTSIPTSYYIVRLMSCWFILAGWHQMMCAISPQD